MVDLCIASGIMVLGWFAAIQGDRNMLGLPAWDVHVPPTPTHPGHVRRKRFSDKSDLTSLMIADLASKTSFTTMLSTQAPNAERVARCRPSGLTPNLLDLV